jgi:hypothetical protein
MSIVLRVTLPVEVEFFYQPAEPPDRCPEARYPGCAEAIEIHRVEVGGIDITEGLESDDIQEIEEAIWAARTD